MFKRFFRVLRFQRADRIARELVVPLRRGLAPFKDEDGEVISDIRDDDFVLTYIFGAVLGCIERAGLVHRGHRSNRHLVEDADLVGPGDAAIRQADAPATELAQPRCNLLF